MIIKKKNILLFLLVCLIGFNNTYSQNNKNQVLINTLKIQNTDNQFTYLKQENDAKIEMMNAKIETINQQINYINENNKSTNNRIDQQQNLLIGFFVSIIALLGVIMGMVVSVRTGLTKPLIKRIEKLEEELKLFVNSKTDSNKKE